MQFNKPTTKEEMYVVLNDLFYYYRVKRAGYEEVSLKELELERLEFNPSTEEQLIEKATELLSGNREREIAEYKNSLNEQMIKTSAQITAIEESAEEQTLQVEKLYADSEEKIRVTAEKNGLINSSAYLDKLAVLENEKNLRIADIVAKKDQKISELSALINSINERINSADTFNALVFEKSVRAKVIELKDEEAQITREVFKYNNGLDEKEQRYANTILQANANLNLKFMEISMGEFTKDQLVDMGYYTDVVNCVCGYYDSLDAVTAYQDIVNEEKLTIYLDDYYSNVVYMYGAKSGLL